MPFFKKTLKLKDKNKNNANTSPNIISTKKTLKLKPKDNKKIESSSNSDKYVEEINDNNLSKYIPPINQKQVKPKYWELPNRKNFFNWVINTFQQYETGKN